MLFKLLENSVHHLENKQKPLLLSQLCAIQSGINMENYTGDTKWWKIRSLEMLFKEVPHTCLALK